MLLSGFWLRLFPKRQPLRHPNLPLTPTRTPRNLNEKHAYSEGMGARKAEGIAAGELAFIAGLRHRFRLPRGPQVALGIGDDCALLRTKPGWEIAVTTDLFLEGRHFRRDTHSAQSSGHRCIARGLSDLAAMGAAPVAAFLSLALPRSFSTSRANQRWLNHFLEGLHALAREHRVPIAGGDTGEAPGEHLLADIVLVGQVEAGKALRRNGARPGDALWVSGELGGSAAQLERLLARANRTQTPSNQPGPQTFPSPRLALGRALARRGLASACLDISDGLSTDLAHLCAESGVTARVAAPSLPPHPLTSKLQPAHALHLALHGGEDYELLFTTRSAARLPAKLAGVSLTRIGTIGRKQRNRPQMTLLGADGTEAELHAGGWEHLRAGAGNVFQKERFTKAR